MVPTRKKGPEMSPKKPAFTNPMAEVVLEPVVVAGKDTGKLAVMVQDDAGEFQHQAMNSRDHKFIKNSQALQIGEGMMSRSPYEWDRLIEQNIWTGKFMSLSYRTTDLVIEIPPANDKIALGLRIENSYDGSVKPRVSLMVHVLSCGNRIFSLDYFKPGVLRDLARGEEDVVEYFALGKRKLENVANRIVGMPTTPLSSSLIIDAASTLSIPGNNFMRALKSLNPEKCSAWDFMQALTYQTTHVIKGRAGLKHGEEIGDFFLT